MRCGFTAERSSAARVWRWGCRCWTRRSFENIDEFRELLLEDKDQLARALTVKLATYATGRAPSAFDQPEIDAVVDKVRDNNYGLRSLVHALVQSDLFRNK